MTSRRSLLAVTLAVGVLASGSSAIPAFAQSAPRPGSVPSTAPSAAQAPADAQTERGRQAYLRGAAASKEEHWGEALTAFEEAAAIRDAPRVQYNIAYCQRALGRYVAARRATQRVLHDTSGLDPSEIENSKAYLVEFEGLIVHVHVTLDPDNAAITIDGRPLQLDDGAPDTYVGSIGAAAEAKPLGKSAFTVVLDPGVHLFRATRAGHQDVVLRETYKPGESATLPMKLDVLPATISIRSEPDAAIVKIDGREVGLAPIDFQRQAGNYKLEVVLDHYETYKATLDLQAGQQSDLTAKLNPYTVPLTKRWWFWTGAAVIVAGGAALTYALTRPAPQPPAYEAGSANWLVQAQGIRW
jgi:PEGA domain